MKIPEVILCILTNVSHSLYGKARLRRANTMLKKKKKSQKTNSKSRENILTDNFPKIYTDSKKAYENCLILYTIRTFQIKIK